VNPFAKLLSAENASYLSDAASKLSSGDGEPAPTPKQVQQMLGICLAASLERDEGRDTTFTMCFARPTDGTNGFILRTPLPANSNALRRLGAAVDLHRGFVCVMPSANDGLDIVGIKVMRGHRELKQGHGVTMALCIRVFGAGVLTVSHGMMPLLVHRGEHTQIIKEPHQAELWSPTRLPPVQLPDPVRVYGVVGRYLAESMVHIGHGGTLLAIPDEVDWENELGDAQSLFKGGPVPCTLVRDALLDASQQERDKFNRMPPKVHAAVNAGDRAAQVLGRQLYTSTDNAVEGCLDWLAQLTATDGMTIVRSDLTVLAFGVIIQARSDGENPRIMRQGLLDATPTDIRLEDLGGGRHQSAARACIRLKGAVAYVASQDGGLTTMRWDEKENALVVMRDLELLL